MGKWKVNANERLPKFIQMQVKGAKLLNNDQYNCQVWQLRSKKLVCKQMEAIFERSHCIETLGQWMFNLFVEISLYHLISTCFVQCNWHDTCFKKQQRKHLTTQMAPSSKIQPQTKSNFVLRVLACVFVEAQDTKAI